MLLGKGEGGSKNPKNVLTYVIYEWSQAFQKNEKQGIETRFSIWSNYVLTKKRKNTQFLDELNRSNLIILTRWIIDKFQMIWILINEPFDEIYLLQSYLDGIFVLWTTWSIGNPQLKYRKK